jgi:hypothetical protein
LGDSTGSYTDTDVNDLDDGCLETVDYSASVAENYCDTISGQSYPGFKVTEFIHTSFSGSCGKILGQPRGFEGNGGIAGGIDFGSLAKTPTCTQAQENFVAAGETMAKAGALTMASAEQFGLLSAAAGAVGGGVNPVLDTAGAAGLEIAGQVALVGAQSVLLGHLLQFAAVPSFASFWNAIRGSINDAVVKPLPFLPEIAKDPISDSIDIYSGPEAKTCQ